MNTWTVRLSPVLLAIAVVALSAVAGPALGQGIALRGIGPVNESMGGAAVAAPIDAAGALHWNPASISGLAASDMSFGLDLILPTSQLSSRIGAGALGGGFPPVTLEGATSGEPGVTPVPMMAFVRRQEDSPLSYGLGLYGIGGSSVNYPSSPTNPILTPQPPNGLGLGRLSANVDVLQIVPTVAYELSPQLSIGFAPTLTLGRIFASPLFLGDMDDANQDGFPSYPCGVGTRYAWGGGFQVGVYYNADSCWHFGASLKSPQWMEPFRFNTEDELGQPRQVRFRLNYPLIASIGASYTGFEKWILACDVRYFDYANTDGFGSEGMSPTGALTGLDWNNIFSVAVGAQRQIGECFFARMGYCFNENPIDGFAAQFNVASPLIIKHTLHMGCSYVFADNWMFSLAYVHGFENDATGQLHSAAGLIPDTSVTSTISADILSVGVSKRF